MGVGRRWGRWRWTGRRMGLGRPPHIPSKGAGENRCDVPCPPGSAP